jgi:hypothetical protein
MLGRFQASKLPLTIPDNILRLGLEPLDEGLELGLEFFLFTLLLLGIYDATIRNSTRKLLVASPHLRHQTSGQP